MSVVLLLVGGLVFLSLSEIRNAVVVGLFVAEHLGDEINPQEYPVGTPCDLVDEALRSVTPKAHGQVPSRVLLQSILGVFLNVRPSKVVYGDSMRCLRSQVVLEYIPGPTRCAELDVRRHGEI